MAKVKPFLVLVDGFACEIRCPQVNGRRSLLAAPPCISGGHRRNREPQSMKEIREGHERSTKKKEKDQPVSLAPFCGCSLRPLPASASVVFGYAVPLSCSGIYENQSSHCGDRSGRLRRMDCASTFGTRCTGYAARCMGPGQFASVIGRRDAGYAWHLRSRSALHRDGLPRPHALAEV